MNPSHFRLVLVLLWLVPGLGLLALDVVSERPLVVLPLGDWSVPLSWVFLLFATFNLLRWWAARPARGPAGERASFRDRRRRTAGEPPAEPDPTFRFDDPPDRPG
jgi:hypothetical protein